jgi:exodeoxyribonuclease VII large subunit
MNAKVYTISQINSYLNSILTDDIVLSGMFAAGEISNLKFHSSGHIYFSMKDRDAAVSCVMFRQSAQGLRFMPKDGMSITVYARAALYEKTGQYQLYVEMMDVMGVGSLHTEFEQLKEKLRLEGLFDTSHKKPLPDYPERIALITSPTGAVVQDMTNIAKRRNASVDLIICPVKVQGEGASDEICKAINSLNERDDIDIIIVARGGGSIEDLWAFNEEKTVRAVYSSVIPVISAIGHETDVTLTDFSADLRAPTPSAAIEICVPLLSDILGRLNYLTEIMSNVINNRINQYRLDTANLIKHMRERILQRIGAYRNRIEIIETLTKQNTIEHILGKGFAVISVDEKIIADVENINPGDCVNIRMKSGSVRAMVTDIWQ